MSSDKSDVLKTYYLVVNHKSQMMGITYKDGCNELDEHEELDVVKNGYLINGFRLHTKSYLSNFSIGFSINQDSCRHVQGSNLGSHKNE